MHWHIQFFVPARRAGEATLATKTGQPSDILIGLLQVLLTCNASADAPIASLRANVATEVCSALARSTAATVKLILPGGDVRKVAGGILFHNGTSYAPEAMCQGLKER